MKFLIALAVGLVLSANALATTRLEQDIEMLLGEIEASNCQFVRNGNSHDGDEGVKHIERKYRHYREEIDSIDTFIELTATKSMMSGKAYQVRCGEEVTTSASWLRQRANDLGLDE